MLALRDVIMAKSLRCQLGARANSCSRDLPPSMVFGRAFLFFFFFVGENFCFMKCWTSKLKGCFKVKFLAFVFAAVNV